LSDKYGIPLHGSVTTDNLRPTLCPRCKSDLAGLPYCLKCRWSIACPFCGCPVLRHDIKGTCAIHKKNCKKSETNPEVESRLSYLRDMTPNLYRIPKCFLCKVDLPVKIEGASETLLCQNCFIDFKGQMKKDDS